MKLRLQSRYWIFPSPSMVSLFLFSVHLSQLLNTGMVNKILRRLWCFPTPYVIFWSWTWMGPVYRLGQHSWLGYIVWQRWRDFANVMKVPNPLTLRSLIKLINLLKLISRGGLPSWVLILSCDFLKRRSKGQRKKPQTSSPVGLEEPNAMLQRGPRRKEWQVPGDEGLNLKLQGAVFCQQPESLKDHPEPQKSLQPWCHPPRAETRITQLHAVPWKLWENKCVLFQVSGLIIIYHAAINS